MIFLVSGEGSSDIGIRSNENPSSDGSGFCPGPMSVIIDKLIEPWLNYSLMGCKAIEFIPENQLKNIEVPRNALRGKKRKNHETALNTKYFYQNARQLARIALEKAKTNQCAVGAVLFRDADGTRSTEKGLYENKWASIEVGFQAEEFNFGVPMVPKPKSEAWLLCALKVDHYQNCNQLELTLSGNDNSPDSAKDQLDCELNRLGKSVGDVVGMVSEGIIDPERIDMPSFNRFRERLKEVTLGMLASKPDKSAGTRSGA